MLFVNKRCSLKDSPDKTPTKITDNASETILLIYLQTLIKKNILLLPLKLRSIH